MVRIAGLIILALLYLTVVSLAQELSTNVYVSEEELNEALKLGEISFTDYLLLKEIMAQGVDSASVYLLDHVPNLSCFLSDTVEHRTDLQQEQQQAFINKYTSRPPWHFRLKYAYHQKLEESDIARYHSSAEIRITQKLRGLVRIHREYDGREQVTMRSLSYRAPEKTLAEFRLGNFTKRFGLGNVTGYRGQLLDRSDHIDGESFAIPDYGGANGAYFSLRLGRSWTLQSLGSIIRDDSQRLITTAMMVSLPTPSLELAGIVGSNRLTNRVSGRAVHDFKLGVFARKGYGNGHAAMEVTLQSGERKGFGGVSLEGRHRFRQADIRYAGWVYGDEYLDLSSGSKTGSFSRRDSLASLEWGFSTRRRGAEGGMFKTIVQITCNTKLINSLILSTLNKNTVGIQSLSGVVTRLKSGLSIRLDHLSKSVKRASSYISAETVDRRTRLEGRLNSGKLSLRSYIGYHTRTGRTDYLSVFLRVRADLERIGRVEFWSNLGRWNMRKKCVDYWYCFIRSRQEILPEVTAAIKLSHSYQREPDSRHETTVSMEVTALVW